MAARPIRSDDLRGCVPCAVAFLEAEAMRDPAVEALQRWLAAELSGTVELVTDAGCQRRLQGRVESTWIDGQSGLGARSADELAGVLGSSAGSGAGCALFTSLLDAAVHRAEEESGEEA